jgi:hypothetical protein
MIVRRLHDRLHLITQPDHAYLAGTIMEQCVLLRSRPRRAAILRAIYEHDNGWREEDDAPGIDPDTGEILDFVNAPLRVRHAVWPRAVARLGDDRWTAALIAQHAITVYDRFRADAAWTSFFTAMEQARDSRVPPSGLSHDDLLEDYQFVRLADLISLTFCTGWTGEQRFAEWRIRPAGARVTVIPDPFAGREVPFRIAARQIPSRRFQSDEDLRQALREAETIALEGTVCGDRILR